MNFIFHRHYDIYPEMMYKDFKVNPCIISYFFVPSNLVNNSKFHVYKFQSQMPNVVYDNSAGSQETIGIETILLITIRGS